MNTINIKKEIEKLEEARKNTKNKREEARLKAIILWLKEIKVSEISKKLDYAPKSIYIWIKNYKKYSIAGILNKKRKGNNRNLSIEEEKELLKEFEEKAKKGQIITAKEIEKAYDRKSRA